jgi:hypothetical protein
MFEKLTWLTAGLLPSKYSVNDDSAPARLTLITRKDRAGHLRLRSLAARLLNERPRNRLHGNRIQRQSPPKEP